MLQSVALFTLAVVLLGLLPIVPRIVAFRTGVLRWLHMYRFANWHERHAPAIVIVVRSIFVVLAIYLLVLVLF
jgi:hypothetical protein